MDASYRMPGDAEAAAAAAGMTEIYGLRGRLHAIGDSIWFQHVVGAMPRQGRVEQIGGHGTLVVRDDAGDSYVIMPSQIAEF